MVGRKQAQCKRAHLRRSLLVLDDRQNEGRIRKGADLLAIDALQGGQMCGEEFTGELGILQAALDKDPKIGESLVGDPFKGQQARRTVTHESRDILVPLVPRRTPQWREKSLVRDDAGLRPAWRCVGP